jgi:hypothetical protein
MEFKGEVAMKSRITPLIQSSEIAVRFFTGDLLLNVKFTASVADRSNRRWVRPGPASFENLAQTGEINSAKVIAVAA